MLLKHSKEAYELNAKKLGMHYYADKDEVTSEELEMACVMIKHLGNVI